MEASVLNFENEQLLLLLKQHLHPSENGEWSRLRKNCLSSFLTPLWEEIFVCFCIQSLLINFSQ